MNKQFTLILTIIFFMSFAQGQSNFRKAFEASRPIPIDSPLSLEEKLNVHQDYLDMAIATNDSLKQIYGYLHLFYDYLLIDDYAEARRYIIDAKQLADQSGNVGWQGWITYRTGVIHYRTDNQEKAIRTYEEAVTLCKAAGDSLCVGESYEQLSAMHGVLGNYESAKQYFYLAIPLLEKYGAPKSLCTAFNNYGGLVSMTGNPAEAIPILENSIRYCKEIKRYKSYAKGLNNIADANRRLGEYEKAIEIYEKCLVFNREHNFTENIIKNYMGMHVVYFESGNYKKASDFLIKRYLLKDSLMGIQVQEKISSLEAKYDNQQKELELQKSKNQLLAAKGKITKLWTIFGLVSLITVFGIWSFYKKRKQLKRELKQNEENLRQLTQTLIRKNTGIKSLEDELRKYSSAMVRETISEEENNLFDQTILTNDDWSTFKINFEKTHRGYIAKLRKMYSNLSDAEERLFLLLKLNLNRNEIAAILGISSDTVKKTRYRLRKRLQLEQENSLDDFIKGF